MKRSLSLLLSILILASVFVMDIGTVSAVTSITSVKVTGVKRPVPGEHPDYSGIQLETVPANAAEIVEACWMDKKSHDLAKDDTFIDGEIYLIYFTIRPKSGYCFEFDGDTQYKGETAIQGYTVDYSEERSNESGSLYLDSKYVKAEQTVEDVVVSYSSEPEGGKPATYYAYSNGTGYIVDTSLTDVAKGIYNGVCWYDQTTSSYITPETDLVYGHSYTMGVAVKSLEGYVFDIKNASINNKTANINSDVFASEYEVLITLNMGKCGKTIFEVEIRGLDEPVVDEAPDYEVSVADSSYQLDMSKDNTSTIKGGVSWNDTAEGDLNFKEDKFALGHTYVVQIAVKPSEGCEFDKNLKVTLNGMEIPSEDIWGGGKDTIYIFKTFNVEYPHIHSFGSEWSYNEEAHYKLCVGCDTMKDYSVHTFTEKIKKQPTYTEEGIKTVVCTVCGYHNDVAIPMLETTDISSCTVSGIKNKTYTGKALTQSITITNGATKLVSNTDYIVSYKNNKVAGKATVTITGKGAYKGTITKTFKITQAKNPMTVKAVTKSVKLSKVKKAKQIVKGAVTVKNIQGTVAYAKVAKGSDKKLTISKKGVITVAKGTKKGTHNIKVKVTTKGNKNYKSLSKTITVSVKVK